MILEILEFLVRLIMTFPPVKKWWMKYIFKRGVNDYISKLIYDFENYEEYTTTNRRRIIELLERADLHKYYIDLNGTDIKGKPYEPIDAYIEIWLKDTKHNQVAILGDYGTGKTSLCLNLTYKLALRYKEHSQTNRIPIFIPLKDHKLIPDINKLIIELFKNSLDFKLLKNFLNTEEDALLTLQEMLKTGKFLLILDGLDEMSERVQYSVTQKNLEKISELAKTECKIILTCRTHFFKTQLDIIKTLSPVSDIPLKDMIDTKLDFEVIYIEPLNQTQIEHFLDKRLKSKGKLKEHLNHIKNIYNLRDLAKRPILLEMIIRTIPFLQKEMSQNIEITATELYKTFTEIWIQRDRNRYSDNPERKKKFMEKLAMDMLLEGGKESIHYSELQETIKLYFFKDLAVTREELEHFENEIRTCSFLICDKKGNYKFAHKSFQEFFLAQMLANELVEKKPELFKKFIYLPVEIYGFINEMFSDSKNHYSLLVNWLNKNYFPVASFIGQMGLKEFIPELCRILSDEQYCEETRYNAARALERLHNSSYQPYFKFILNWKEHDDLSNYYKFNSIAIRGNKRKKPEPGFSPATYILKSYEDHPDDQWMKISQILIESMDNSPLFVRINSAHALIRWLHLNHIEKINSMINKENDPHVKGNLFLSIVKLIYEGRLDQQFAKLYRYDLSNATLRDINLQNYELSKIKFQSSFLQGAIFDDSILVEADFRRANLSGASFQNTDLRKANFQEANLEAVNFNGAKLEGTIF